LDLARRTPGIEHGADRLPFDAIRDFSASVSQRPSRLAERKGYSTYGSTVSWRWLHAAVSTAKEDVISMLQTRERIDNNSKREHEEFTGPASQ
jgi:hypothetical protein